MISRVQTDGHALPRPRRAVRVGALLAAGAAAVLGVSPSGDARAQDATPGVDRAAVLVDVPAGRRPGGLVTVGIPLSRELDVRDPRHVGLWRTGEDGAPEPLDVQVRALSRWDAGPHEAGAPLRWVLVHARPGEARSLRLRTGKGVQPAEREAPVALAEPEKRRYVVDTGALRFHVASGTGAPLRSLLVRTVRDDGVSYARQMVGEGGGLAVELVNVESDGATERAVERTYRFDGAADAEVRLVENGPLRAVFEVRGAPRDAAGRALLAGAVRVSLRLVAERGSDALNVSVSLDHTGPYGHAGEVAPGDEPPPWLFLRRLSVTVPGGLESPGAVSVDTGSWNLATDGDPDIRLLQRHRVVHRDREDGNFRWTLAARTADRADEGVRVVHSGARSDGGLLVDDGKQGVFACVRHFWQQHPAGISWTNGRLAYELLPQASGLRWPSDLDRSRGDGFQIEGGRGKTWDLHLAFPRFDADQPPTAAARRAIVRRRQDAVQRPVRARPDARWIAVTGALGDFAPPLGAADGSELDFAVRHLDRLRRGLVDTRSGDRQLPGGRLPPVSLTTQRERRGTAVPGAVPELGHYGFFAFGDVAHQGGFASTHHDWSRGLLLAWLGLGDRSFLEHGLEMARHRADVDQYHCTAATGPGWEWRSGFQRFPAGAHGDRTRDLFPQGEAPPAPSRTWLEGMLLAHLLTGESRYLDVADANAAAFRSLAGATLSDPVLDEQAVRDRLPAWGAACDQLLAHAELTGDRESRAAALDVFRSGLSRLHALMGETESFAPPGSGTDLLPFVCLLRPLARVHAALKDAPRAADRALGDQALELLLRLLGWMRTDGMARTGEVEAGLYRPLQLSRVAGSDPGGYVPFNLRLADAWAYVHRATGSRPALEHAARLLRDSVLFYQAPPGRPLPPAFYGAASFSPVRYAGHATRPGAWLLTGHHTVLTELARLDEPITLDEGLLPVYGPDRPGAVRALRVVARTSDGATGTGPVVRPRDDVPDVPKPSTGDDTPTPLPPPKPIELDDDDATWTGVWVQLASGEAVGGAQRVSLDPQRPATATYAARVERGGRYHVSLRWGVCAGASPNARVRIEHADGEKEIRVNQSVNAGEWRLVGEVRLDPTKPLIVRIDRSESRGAVLADGVRIEAVR